MVFGKSEDVAFLDDEDDFEMYPDNDWDDFDDEDDWWDEEDDFYDEDEDEDDF